MERYSYIDYTMDEGAILERRWELDELDPHAYWLMNRMMQTVSKIRTADDCWEWMLAMKDNIQEYNARLGRKIGSVDAACNAINELMKI